MSAAEIKDENGNQPLKFTLTHYRLPEHTHEAFIEWIVAEHLPLALPIFKKHGILEYKIFTTPADLNAGLKGVMIERRPTWDFADYDCFLEYTVPDLQTISNVMSDPDWPEAIKDESKWVDTSRSLVSVGYVTPYLTAKGEFLNLPK